MKKIKQHISDFIANREAIKSNRNHYLKSITPQNAEGLLKNKAFNAVCDQILSNSMNNIINDDDNVEYNIIEAKTIVKMQNMLKNYSRKRK